MKKLAPVILTSGYFESQKDYGTLLQTKPRICKCYEWDFFSSDGGTAFVNGEAFPIKKGSVILCHPGDERHSQLHFSCYNFHFLLPEKELFPLENIHQRFFSAGCFSLREEEMRDIVLWSQSAKEEQRYLLSSLLTVLLSRFCGEQQKPSAHPLLQQAMVYAQTHFGENITVQTMAQYCHISPSYLFRLFQQQCACSPMDYVTGCRIHSAQNLLLNTDLPLGEIALRCGFDSPGYFSYVFHRRVGLSPSQYRREG